MTDQTVEAILAPSNNLYDVLGVNPQNLEKSALRKAYLTTSVKVHPDKNSHPQATEAFQRVAEAYNTLNDEVARADYDAELRHSSRGHSQPQYAYDFERTHMPSFQEALFMFATATSMFAGGSGAEGATRSGSAANAATDFVETLFWAQKLAEKQQQQQHPQNNGSTARGSPGDDFNHDPNNKTTGGLGEAAAKDPLSSGMALGSGLRALASAQRAMGLKKSATATEKAATTVQVAAMGATALKAANENPAVRRTLNRGQNFAKDNPQIGKGLRASLKMAGSVVMAMQEAQRESQQSPQRSSTGSRR